MIAPNSVGRSPTVPEECELYKCFISEINTIPSLAALPNTIDSFVKQPLVAEMFNIVGFHVPQQVTKT